MVVARIETLKEAALHPEHGERARVTAQELIGSVRLLEEDEHVIAEQRAETWRRWKYGHGVRDIGRTLGSIMGRLSSMSAALLWVARSASPRHSDFRVSTRATAAARRAGR